MTTPTLAEMLEQQNALQLQIEAAEIPALTAIATALAAPAIADALAALQADIGNLSGERKTQAGNLITTLTHCPAFLANQLAEIEARQAPVEPDPVEGEV